MGATENISRYFPPAKTSLDSGCHVVSFGFEKVPPHSKYPLREHPQDHLFSYQRGRVLSTYVLEVVIAGGGHLETEDSRPGEVQAGDVFLLFPEKRHRYRPTPESGWSKWWIEMSGPVLENWIDLAAFDPAQPVFFQAAQPALLETIQEMNEITREDRPPQPLLLSSLALNLVARTSGALMPPFEKTDRMFLVTRRARQIIREQTLNAAVDWTELSRELGVSYSALRHAFTKIVGLSPGQYHLFLRQRQALALLRNSDLRIADISQQLGFESTFYFSRFIKQRTGHSPRALRGPQPMSSDDVEDKIGG